MSPGSNPHGIQAVVYADALEGSSIPETLRFRTADGAGDTGVDFHDCRPFAASSGDTLEMPFDALDFQCWMGTDAPFASESALVIAWSIPSDPFSSHPFDFCVKDVRPMLGDTAPEPLGPLQGSVQPILR